MGSTTGQLFRVTTFGESHGGALGAVVEGCPPGLELDLEAIQAECDRRRPGQSRLTTQRRESDTVEVLIKLRAEARANKNFALSDKIRDELLAVGIQLKDGKDGTAFSTN